MGVVVGGNGRAEGSSSSALRFGAIRRKGTEERVSVCDQGKGLELKKLELLPSRPEPVVRLSDLC